MGKLVTNNIEENTIKILSKRLKEAANMINELAYTQNEMVREQYERKASFYQVLACLANHEIVSEDLYEQ